MTVLYRRAKEEDTEALLGLMREMQHDDPWSAPFVEAKVADSVRELIAGSHYGSAWLICEGDIAIGYIVLCFDYSLEYGGKGAWIDEFYIRGEHRGKGLGAAALQFAEEKAAAAGARVLHLEVNRGNPAIGLYRRAGFEDHERYLMSKWLRD